MTRSCVCGFNPGARLPLGALNALERPPRARIYRASWVPNLTHAVSTAPTPAKSRARPPAGYLSKAAGGIHNGRINGEAKILFSEQEQPKWGAIWPRERYHCVADRGACGFPNQVTAYKIECHGRCVPQNRSKWPAQSESILEHFDTYIYTHPVTIHTYNRQRWPASSARSWRAARRATRSTRCDFS